MNNSPASDLNTAGRMAGNCAGETISKTVVTPKLEYRTGRRKRKMLGYIVDVRMVAGEPVYKIRKRLRHTWVNSKDVVKVYGMENQTETTEGAVDADGGRDQTQRNPEEIDADGRSVYADLAPQEKGVIADLQTEIKTLMEKDPDLKTIPVLFEDSTGEQGQGKTDVRIQPDQKEVAGGQDVPMLRGWDMCGAPARGDGHSPLQGAVTIALDRNEILHPALSGSASVDRSEPSASKSDGADSRTVERPRVKKAPNAETEAKKKRVLREAARTKQISNHAEFIGQLAEQNDARFFIRLAEALKKKKP